MTPIAELENAIGFYSRSPDGQYDDMARRALELILEARLIMGLENPFSEDALLRIRPMIENF